jgi:ankyrin repeat protein
MDTLPLPPRPDLDQYRKRAKTLVVAANSGDANAVKQWADDWLRTLTRLLGVEITPFVQHSFERAVEGIEKEVASRISRAEKDGSRFALADAQHLLAQAHSYENWADFAREIEGLRSEAGQSDFERAADAVVTGDLARLNEMLEKNPSLVHEHSARKHRATLLHYVAANGVEDFRQKTPPNAVEIARRLIEAGAAVDALADTYGADKYQTTMNLLVSSTHPAEAGLQSKLVEVLLDHGAAVDGLDGNASPILTALAFGYSDAADTLARRGASVDHVVIAAAVGNLDVVREYVADARTLKRKTSLNAFPAWVHIPEDAAAQIEMAFVWACKFGRADVAKFLLDRSVNPAAKDNDEMMALHWASARGLMEIMDLLLAAGVPLEVRNTWGGTVLDSTAWFAVNAPTPGVDYPQIIERLLKAGADPNEVYPPSSGIAEVDSILENYRTNRKD